MTRSSLDTRRRTPWVAAAQDVGVVFAATLLTAFVALLVEDALPNRDEHRVFWPRVAFFLLLLGVLTFVLWLRRLRVRARGTLYYLRYLPDWMRDTHLGEYNLVRGAYRDTRVVTRWMMVGQIARMGSTFPGPGGSFPRSPAHYERRRRCDRLQPRTQHALSDGDGSGQRILQLAGDRSSRGSPVTNEGSTVLAIRVSARNGSTCPTDVLDSGTSHQM